MSTERATTYTDDTLAVLRCPWDHVHLWPVDLEPFPRECMAKVASLPNGEWPTCGKYLHVARIVVGQGIGSSQDPT